VQRVTKQLIKNAHSLPQTLSDKEEHKVLKDAEEFFKKQFACNVFVLKDSEGKHEKSKNALPDKPAIVIE